MEEALAKALEGATVDGKFLMYKERPLVREANVICYGNMEDEYVLLLTIMTTTQYKGKEVPDKILIQILKTDKDLPAHEKIAKQDMKTGLYESFELGIIWLERLLGEM